VSLSHRSTPSDTFVARPRYGCMTPFVVVPRKRAARFRPAALYARRWCTALLLVVFGAGVIAPRAGAAAGKLKPGKTAALRSGEITIALVPSVYAVLTQQWPLGTLMEDETLTAIAPATMVSAGVFTSPIDKGKLDITGPVGAVTARGGLAFSWQDNGGSFGHGGFQVGELALRFPKPITSKDRRTRHPQALLTTTVYGEGGTSTPDIPVAALDMASATRSRHGKSIRFTGIKLKLADNAHTDNPIGGMDAAVQAGSLIGTASLIATS